MILNDTPIAHSDTRGWYVSISDISQNGDRVFEHLFKM